MNEPMTSRPVRRGLLPVIMLALAAVVSAVASLNVAIPSIARDTRATQTELSWIIDAYALVFAALLLLGGAIGDRWGRRRALVAGLAIFGAGSLAAMFAADPTWLIVLRAVLGIGAALVMPATLSTITSTFPAAERPRAVGAWAGMAGASAILGLLVSGLLLEAWSWRSVFGLNVALALIALPAVLRVVPESTDADAPRLDLVGSFLTVLGLGLVVYSVIEAPTTGWADPRTVIGLLAGLAVLTGFVRWELARPQPMLDPRLFGYRAFSAGTLSLTLQFFAFFGFIFLILQYLQLVLERSAIVAALSLVPMALGLMPGARVLAPRLVPRIGTRAVCTSGLVVAAAALLLLSRLDSGSGYWLLLAGLVPLGLGMGMAMTPATSAITDALPAEKQGVGSAMNDLARELGGALGIAVLGSVLQSVYRSHLELPGLPASAAERARPSLGAATHLGPQVQHAAQQAFVDGMQVAFLYGSVVAVLAAVAVSVLLRRPRSSRAVEAAAAGAYRRSAAEVAE
jgi:EmrB/QacA subfamily drug resistance transporter